MPEGLFERGPSPEREIASLLQELGWSQEVARQEAHRARELGYDSFLEYLRSRVRFLRETKKRLTERGIHVRPRNRSRAHTPPVNYFALAILDKVGCILRLERVPLKGDRLEIRDYMIDWLEWIEPDRTDLKDWMIEGRYIVAAVTSGTVINLGQIPILFLRQVEY